MSVAVPALPDVPEVVGSLGKSPPGMEMRLPTAPRSPTAARSPPSYGRAPGGHGGGFPAAGGPSRALPTQPPFKAFIGNLPHAAEERDIAELFSDLKVPTLTWTQLTIYHISAAQSAPLSSQWILLSISDHGQHVVFCQCTCRSEWDAKLVMPAEML